MNELICTLIIIIVSVVLGVVIYGLSKILPPIIDYIKCFIRWNRRK